MSIDKNGYITIPQPLRRQTEFSAMIENVTLMLTNTFAQEIHSLYVYGSVAQGKATIGLSDLDMTLIFAHALSPTDVIKLAEVKSILEQNNPSVIKIDFEYTSLAQVFNPVNCLGWRYWLKHHCLCIYGKDLRKDISPFKPSLSIAIAVNGDFKTVIHSLITELQSTTDTTNRLHLQRAIARKAIRSTNILRDKEDKEWPSTLNEYCEKCQSQYPFLAADIDYLLDMASKPEGNRIDFISRILSFTQWLDTEFQRKQKEGY